MAKKMIFLILFFVVVFVLFLNKNTSENGNSEITNIEIFQDTPAWKLAIAVEDENSKAIEKIVKKQPQLINFQEKKYGATLLIWSIGMEKYKSAEVLLKNGADPDIATIPNGETPLFIAAAYSWVDNNADKDPKYVKLLLNDGADPNKNYIGSERTVIQPGSSPLMNSIGCGIEKTKAILEAGANINYKTPNGETAAIYALLFQNYPEYAYYLIVQEKGIVSDPYFRIESYDNEEPTEKLYPVNILRRWVFDLESKEYRMKMEIVAEFARQGVNYWETSIDEDTMNQIKILYPASWEEYIKKY